MIKATVMEKKLAYSIDELAAMTSMSKSFLRAAIRANKLKAKKFGARVLVLAADWESYAESQVNWQPANLKNN